MKNITICLTYFKSLALCNLEAALYSVRRQDLSHVNSIVVVDNDTEDSIDAIEKVIREADFKIPVCFGSFKHGDDSKTHAWSTNIAARCVETSWVFFTRADYILESGIIEQFQQIAEQKSSDWNGMITSRGLHLAVDVGVVNQSGWRHAEAFPMLSGSVINYTEVDTGVWMMPKRAFDAVGGLEEKLTAWGHAQTHFQHKLYLSGAEFVQVPKIMFFHPLHSAPRDLDLANRQLADIGIDLKEMWLRSAEKVY